MVSHFQQPELNLPREDQRKVVDLLSASADLTLVVGGDDVIADLSHTLRDASAAQLPSWRGRPIEEVVRGDSRPTLKAMLLSARAGKTAKRFDLNHALDGGRDLPMQYSAFRIDGDGRVILVGRDLRPLAELQSQLLANRQSLEQNARRQKQSEAHYRLLFETAAEAMLVVDAETAKIREANPRAAAILGVPAGELTGKRLAAAFDRPHQARVQSMLAQVAASGAAVRLSIADIGGADVGGADIGGGDGGGGEGVAGRRLDLEAELFRAADLKLVLVRLSVPGAGAGAGDDILGDLVRNAAEAVLVADEEGEVVWVNESFLSLAGLPLAAHAVGRKLDNFFQWNGIEESVLLANVRRHGRVPTFSATVRGANGQATEVELSVVARTEAGRSAAGQPSGGQSRGGQSSGGQSSGDQSGPGEPCGYAFVMRARAQGHARPGRGNSDLTRAAEALTEMVGRVPMKDMVRDTTDVIERMCIEAALKLTGNNRASAARVLGLSRQALYLKMNRFGIADDGE